MKKLLILPALAVLALAPAAGAATKKKTHKVALNATVVSHAVGANGPDAGSVTDPGLGNGATVYTSTGTATTQTVTFQVWFAAGSIKGVAHVTLGTAANGQTPFSGSGNITGGTLKYKGSKGTAAFTGFIETGTTAAPGPGYVHIFAKGTFTYRS
jgi:hypothetical protein